MTLLRLRVSIHVGFTLFNWIYTPMRHSSQKEKMYRPIESIAEEKPGEGVGFIHSHKWCQLQYATKGIMHINAGNHSYIIPPQRAVWIPTNVEHQVNHFAPVSYRSLHIDETLGGRLGNQVKVIQVSPFLRELVLRGCEAWQGKYPMTDVNSALMTLLIEELTQAPVSPLHLPWPADSRLKSVCSVLQDNPADNRTLAELAHNSGASVRTLNRLFVKECEMSFSTWRQKLRVLGALELLQKQRPITEIALELGYESSSAFITVFKKHLNASPKSYMRNLMVE
ncbi:helix-turn-helix transcriptional regulator [Vibrio profundum]|uniref:AraC family transcriptional regulator n=1 Tax=Vibrio profundum TaxID=2910247 RepID=UPI003D1061BC